MRYICTSIVGAALLSTTGTGLGQTMDFFPQQVLTSLDGATNGYFGFSVAIEGATAVIGADGVDSETGTAYVFTRDAGGTWNQFQEISDPDGTQGDLFGYKVVLVGDIALIGAPGVDSNTGSVHVFASDESGIWIQRQELVASGGVQGDYFGQSIAIDGETAIIGAWGVDGVTGSAYVFTRDGSGTWSQAQKLTASDGAAGDYFGWSVALDGDTAVIGAWGTHSETGSAVIFTRDGSDAWSQAQELTASDAAQGSAVGVSVAIDGTTAMIGAPGASDNAGTAYLFTRDAGNTWSEAWAFTAPDGANNDYFGGTVAIDGDTGLISEPGFNGEAGSVHVLERDAGGIWNLGQELTAPDQSQNANFGFSIAIDGDTVMIGANEANDYVGNAYAFSRDASMPCLGDEDGDGSVDVLGLLAVISAWGECDGDCPSDFDANGIVDVIDLLIVFDAWGDCP
ncbi:MAG: hypothetical protein HN559_10525 [Gemmatimonadetes bacterium]|nr:hypothetical protein [Gemmatimonadota bacterium]